MKKILILFLLVTSTQPYFAKAEENLLRLSQNPTLEKKMNKVKAEVNINAPIEKVWDIIGTKFDQNHWFILSADKAFYLDEPKNGNMIGAKRRVVNAKGKVMDVEVTEFSTDKLHISWEIYNTNAAPIKAGYASYSLRENGQGGTILQQNAGFKMKIFFMDWVAKFKFTEMFKTDLSAIKHYVETGEKITVDNKEQIVKKYVDSVSLL
jgi:uncharacterized protein YndB with AHSA1/START domain